jgi:hypothetical protein
VPQGEARDSHAPTVNPGASRCINLHDEPAPTEV